MFLKAKNNQFNDNLETVRDRTKLLLFPNKMWYTDFRSVS